MTQAAEVINAAQQGTQYLQPYYNPDREFVSTNIPYMQFQNQKQVQQQEMSMRDRALQLHEQNADIQRKLTDAHITNLQFQNQQAQYAADDIANFQYDKPVIAGLQTKLSAINSDPNLSSDQKSIEQQKMFANAYGMIKSNMGRQTLQGIQTADPIIGAQGNANRIDYQRQVFGLKARNDLAQHAMTNGLSWSGFAPSNPAQWSDEDAQNVAEFARRKQLLDQLNSYGVPRSSYIPGYNGQFMNQTQVLQNMDEESAMDVLRQAGVSAQQAKTEFETNQRIRLEEARGANMIERERIRNEGRQQQLESRYGSLLSGRNPIVTAMAQKIVKDESARVRALQDAMKNMNPDGQAEAQRQIDEIQRDSDDKLNGLLKRFYQSSEGSGSATENSDSEMNRTPSSGRVDGMENGNEDAMNPDVASARDAMAWAEQQPNPNDPTVQRVISRAREILDRYNAR